MTNSDPSSSAENIRLAVALIRKIEDKNTRWLVVKNVQQGQWEFVVTQRLEKESGIEALSREVAWRLNLDRKKDFLVSKMALIHVSEPASESGFELPDGDPAEVQTMLDFIPIDIYRDSVWQKLQRNADVRWISSAEVCDGKLGDEIIDPTFCRWNRKWKLIRPWVS